MTLRILHFADAHIDMVNYGRQDPTTGLPIRVQDFLRSLDTIVDTAIYEKVDLVLFAGDAYKDRTPSPTYQREWGKRIIRLSKAGIPTILLVGNHDISPSLGRAHAIQEFQTLEVPNIHVAAKPGFLTPKDLGIPIQVITIPWVSRSEFIAAWNLTGKEANVAYETMETRLSKRVDEWLADLDKELPTILCAHASVQGAKYGSEQTVMLGSDVFLPGSLVRDPRFDYVALGHLHKAQNLNEGNQPPVVYSGSIERVDFGEAQDEKFFVIASIDKGKTEVEWRKLEDIRPFYDCKVKINSADEKITEKLIGSLPSSEKIKEAVIRLSIQYPRDMESLIDENAIRKFAAEAFSLQIIRQPILESRVRIPSNQAVSDLSPMDLLDLYWKTIDIEPGEQEILNNLAEEILTENDMKETG
ncbi:MAG TPA: exonuclease SbcCD subunit D [Anaerolineales bacterium]|nr:exonuclease SbcCD subunit D [Anaerolineales bacterium]